MQTSVLRNAIVHAVGAYETQRERYPQGRRRRLFQGLFYPCRDDPLASRRMTTTGAPCHPTLLCPSLPFSQGTTALITARTFTCDPVKNRAVLQRSAEEDPSGQAL
jgi:hypothetical protein